MTLSVQVVVLNWRTPDMSLDAATAALTQMEGIAGGVTIVDNGSGDGSFERMQAAVQARGWDRARVAVVQSGWNGGFGAGNNHGVRQGLPDGSRPDLVYLLNSDAIPSRVRSAPWSTIWPRIRRRASPVRAFAAPMVRRI